jgi:hypothetical protein
MRFIAWFRVSHRIAATAAVAFVAAACEQSSLTDPPPLTPAASLSADDAGSASSYTGHASTIRATLLGATTIIGQAGPLPEEGGADDFLLAGAGIPGVLSAGLVHAATIAAGDEVVSEASVANLQLKVGLVSVRASLVRAAASAQCGEGSSVETSSASHIAALVVNGKNITVTGQPNQTIRLPLGLGRVVINEVIESDAGITVNALHVYVGGLTSIVVAQAHAGLTCVQEEQPCTDDDFVTGDGFITGTQSGGRGDFALTVGIDGGVFFEGHLNYIDNSPGGPLVVGTGITRYLTLDARTRRIEGPATVNGQPGFTFIVVVVDNGPGQLDTFSISLSNGYSASGQVTGGGIELVSDLCPVPT